MANERIANMIERMEVRVRDLRADTHKEEGRRLKINHINVLGRTLKPTERFHTSLMAKYGFSKSIYGLYSPDEVFTRISEVFPHDNIILTIEKPPVGHKDHGTEKLLAISGPTNIRVDHLQLLELFAKYGISDDDADYGTNDRIKPRLITEDADANIALPGIDHADPNGAWANVEVAVPCISYENGIVRSIHTPNNNRDFTIDVKNYITKTVVADAYQNRFVMDTPIDGYGKPALYLMLLRMASCSGLIAISPYFRADLSLGKKEDNFQYAMVRAFEGYNNEEGYNALRDKLESATRSWASINEIDKVYKALAIMHNTGEVADHVWSTAQDEARRAHAADDNVLLQGSPVMRSFHEICSDLHRTYGLANLSALGIKRQRTLPSGVSVYQLLTFISDVATHYAKPAGGRRLQAIIGEMVSAEYDLEGTLEKFPDWKRFMTEDKNAAESLEMAKNAGK